MTEIEQFDTDNGHAVTIYKDDAGEEILYGWRIDLVLHAGTESERNVGGSALFSSDASEPEAIELMKSHAVDALAKVPADKSSTIDKIRDLAVSVSEATTARVNELAQEVTYLEQIAIGHGATKAEIASAVVDALASTKSAETFPDEIPDEKPG